LVRLSLSSIRYLFSVPGAFHLDALFVPFPFELSCSVPHRNSTPFAFSEPEDERFQHPGLRVRVRVRVRMVLVMQALKWRKVEQEKGEED